jgi:hypothetical protein
MPSEAVIVGQLDLETARAQQRIDEFVRDAESRTIRLGVDIDPKTASRTTLSGQELSGNDAESVAMPAASRGSGIDLQAELQRRWVQTIPASSIGGNVGAFGVPPVPSAATNSRYGSVGHERFDVGDFGSVQPLPGQQIGRAIAKEIAAQPATPFNFQQAAYRPVATLPAPAAPVAEEGAVRQARARVVEAYNKLAGNVASEARQGPPLVTPPPERQTTALAVRRAVDETGPALGGDGTPTSPYRVRTRRLVEPNPTDFVDPAAERAAEGMAGLRAAYPSTGPSNSSSFIRRIGTGFTALALNSAAASYRSEQEFRRPDPCRGQPRPRPL